MLAFSLLLGTTADDLFPLFDKYGKVVDVFIPRDRRSPSLSLTLTRPHTCNFCFQFGVFWLVIGPENHEVSLLFGISMRTRHRRRWKSSMVSFIFSNSESTIILLAGFIHLFVYFTFSLGKIVDGREIMVQFAKYGPNAERMYVANSV